jgi:large subunit ribosomal protein L17
MLANMAKNLLRHGRVRTTPAKAKETSRVVDRLITLGKEGSVHARRRAYQVLRDRDEVKRLFAEIAPRFQTTAGGYTRVLHLGPRAGDGAPQVLMELTHLPAEGPRAPRVTRAEGSTTTPSPSAPAQESPKKPQKFFEGLRGLFHRRKPPS